jgi:hypothetical protein
VLDNPKIVPAHAIGEGTDLIVAAHTHARVSNEALARSRSAASATTLRCCRAIAASRVEWTILEGDPIAGGSVYHLADGWDAGAIAAQDWCFVAKGETARELWERALAPMGLKLLARVVRDAGRTGSCPRTRRTSAMRRGADDQRSVVVTEDQPSTQTSLVVTVMGPDRPGIVSLLSDRRQRYGANWAASRLANLAGEFAGMVHFEVPRENADRWPPRCAASSRPGCASTSRRATAPACRPGCAASSSS